MSQEKVDRYKKQKANRKEIIKKEKRNKIIAKVVGSVVCLSIVGWLGWSLYGTISAKNPIAATEVNLDAISDYFNSVAEAEE
ncbi:hypothetical protein LQZ18_19145 [Lachnospiraceae bacterium ZAX-1]